VSGSERPPPWLRAAPFLFVGLWSGGFTAIRLGLDHAEPLTLQCLRYGVIVAALLPAWLVLRPPLPGRAQLRDLAMLGLLIQTIYFAGCFLAQAHGVTAAGLALVISLQPILVGLLAPHLAGEAVDRRRWLGLLLGLAGCGTVILSGAAVRVGGAGGLAAAFMALAAMTAGTLYEKRFGRPCHPVTSNLVQFGTGLVLTLPLAWATETMRVDWGWGLAGPLAYLVLANSLIAISLLLAMIRRGEAARVSALFFLVPPLAALIAWRVLGEPISAPIILGTALAALGVVLAQRGGAAKPG
jgi:drug/metabolite transporter (DMT)-like permease